MFPLRFRIRFRRCLSSRNEPLPSEERMTVLVCLHSGRKLAFWMSLRWKMVDAWVERGVCKKWIFIRQKCALPGFYPFMHLSIHIKCLMCWIYLRRFLIKEFLFNKSIFNHFPGFTWWRKLRHQGFNKILRLTAFLKKNLRKSASVCRRNLCPEQPIKIKELPSLYF